jgi:hypothetical protein
MPDDFNGDVVFSKTVAGSAQTKLFKLIFFIEIGI